jgi:hypothetical protein
MTIDDYIEAIIPIINLCLKEIDINKQGYKKTHLWYLYRQSFYGFTEFIDWKTRCKASVGADQVFTIKNPGNDIRNYKWPQQNDFDGKSRFKGIFLLEHIYTGIMFREAITKLPLEEITIQKIRQIIDNNYFVAWILRDEDKKLGRLSRGESYQDALNYYESKGVILL